MASVRRALQTARPVIDGLIEAFDVPGHEARLLFRRRVPRRVEIVFVCVRATDKANVRAEVASPAEGGRLDKEVPAGFRVLAQISQAVAGAIDLPPVAECPVAPTHTHAVNRGIEFRIAEEPS